MSGSKASQQNIAQSTALPLAGCLFPKCIEMHYAQCTGVPQVSDTHTNIHPHDVKKLKNDVHQTRPPASIAPWLRSEDHVPIVSAFRNGHDHQHGHSDSPAAMQPHT